MKFMKFYESFKFKADYVSSTNYLHQFEVSVVIMVTVSIVTALTGWLKGGRVYWSNW